jgi:hypothetical protein
MIDRGLATIVNSNKKMRDRALEIGVSEKEYNSCYPPRTAMVHKGKAPALKDALNLLLLVKHILERVSETKRSSYETSGSESWVQTNLWFKNLDATCFRRLLLEFVSPTVKELESRGIIKTFHFLFEPDPHFFLRIEPNSPNDLEKVKHVVRKHLSAIRDLLVTHAEEQEFTSYSGEAEDYGVDGWFVAKRVFEMGSKMAIAQIDSAFRKGRKFDEGKILHCFLNSIGHSVFGIIKNDKFVTSEAMFHLKQFIARIMIIRGKRSLDSETEQETRKLADDEIKQWKGKTMEII